jgi:hypothetical protein
MKRIITATVTVLATTAVLLGLAVRASASIPLPGTNCSFSAQYLPDPALTQLYFSYNNGLFQTPVTRAQGCGHVYVESLGVYNAPACFVARIRTYTENGEVNYDGSYMRWDRVGQRRDIRNGYINNGRRFRIFAVPCDVNLRHPDHPPGFNVYTRAE